jgi:integrase/recombinase XerD
MTRLRQRMLDDLRRRNYSPDTIRGYIRAVRQFAEYFRRSPEQLGAAELRRYQLHLLHESKLALGTVENNISALRFLYKKTQSACAPWLGCRPAVHSPCLRSSICGGTHQHYR